VEDTAIVLERSEDCRNAIDRTGNRMDKGSVINKLPDSATLLRLWHKKGNITLHSLSAPKALGWGTGAKVRLPEVWTSRRDFSELFTILGLLHEISHGTGRYNDAFDGEPIESTKLRRAVTFLGEYNEAKSTEEIDDIIKKACLPTITDYLRFKSIMREHLK